MTTIIVTHSDFNLKRIRLLLLKKAVRLGASLIVQLQCTSELEDVKKKIKTGELTLSNFEFGGESEAWNHFKQVVGSDNMCRL